jgi:biotin carboxyl carrier protein
LKLQIKIDGKTYVAEVEVLDENASHEPVSEAAPAAGAYTPAHVAETHSADEKQYRSPVTGLVIKMNVQPGQAVQANDVLLVLEAMKMETTIAAHHAGKVKSINVAPGNPVKLHQVLVEME